jgi:MFS transporter, DHA1 family, multidrug resistance protein
MLLQKQPNTKKQFFLFIVSMVMMSMIGIFSSDVYLPSMPAMASYFSVDYSLIQKTITVYLIALALFQLFYGALSDHIGRRPVVITGVIIYCAASIACALSSTIGQLLCFRFIQAMGACAALVMGRTIISDLYNKKESLQIFSIVLPIITISPVLAPVLGGYIQHALGWRYVMGTSLIFGTILLFLILFFMGETIPKKKTNAFKVKSIVKQNFQLIKVFDFFFHCLIVGLLYSNWFSYLANSAFIYHSFGLSVTLIGFCYMSQSFSSMTGSFLLKKLLKREVSVITITLVSLSSMFVIAIPMLIFTQQSLPWFLILITAMMFFYGMLLPSNIGAAISSALEHHESVGGTASGLLGFIQILGGAIGTALVGFYPHDIKHLMLIMMTVFAIAILLTVYKMFRKPDRNLGLPED